MRTGLRRFAAVGSIVTTLDLSVVLALRLGLGVPVVVADIVAVSLAGGASYLLHRSLTFADDPHVRWVREPATFAWIMLVAGLVDVAVIRGAVGILGSRSADDLVLAKGVALAAAGLFRFRAYRSRLFQRVREEQTRRAERPPPPGEVRFSVVIPAFGEESRIGSTVSRLREELASAAVDGGLEIIVVDDGSPDGTAEAAGKAGADQVLVQPRNRGKGAAVRAGVLASRGRAVIFTDADLSYPPDQLLRVLGEVETGWDVVVGTRRHVETVTLVQARRLREVSGRLFNSLTHAVLLGHYRDTQCGLKGFRSDAARRIFAATRVDGFAFDVEIFHLVERYRLSLAEVPVTLLNSNASTVKVGIDAVRMVRDLFRIRRWAGRGLYQLGGTDETVIDRR